MADESLALAKAEYARGCFSEALRLAQRASVHSKLEAAERDCLVCECLQYRGELDESLRRAQIELGRDLCAEHTARYWQVIGRIRLEQLRREDAAEALRKGLRAADKSADLMTVAWGQQLWLVAVGEGLGPGLSSAVREAYHAAVRTGDGTALAGFHVRLARLEGQRGAFEQSLHHLALAKSLLDRSHHVALLALYHVNLSCVLATTGSFDEARRNGELGAALAEQAGHVRLAMAAAATISYIAVSAGDLSVAESWLRKARGAASTLGVMEVGLLDSLASVSLIQGDLGAAANYVSEARRSLESRELRWTSATEVLTLFTELNLHKRSGNRAECARVLSTIRNASDTIKDHHSTLLVTLAEAEAFFDERDYPRAREKLVSALRLSPHHPVYLAQLHRIVARSLWIDGHQSSAKRRLLRATSSALIRGTRLAWSETLREARSVEGDEAWEAAYSLAEQARHADSKFVALASDKRPTWYQESVPSGLEPRDPLDGFDDAVNVLTIGGDPMLRGREALATAIALGITDGGASGRVNDFETT